MFNVLVFLQRLYSGLLGVKGFMLRGFEWLSSYFPRLLLTFQGFCEKLSLLQLLLAVDCSVRGPIEQPRNTRGLFRGAGST